ncbi:MAG: M48 family metallopeptidase [Deltaproteobacteria bacterium]
MKAKVLYLFSLIVLTNFSCKFSKNAYEKTTEVLDNVNIFTYQDDIKLGQQVKQEIESDPAKFPILDEKSNPQIYSYLRELRDIILNTNQLKYKDKFPWEIRVIRDDKTLNAFATPGGYIYIYTGLLKFLDSEDELMGVIGHEMAHADLRHSTKQLTKNLGIAILLDAALGDKNSVEQIAAALIGIQFTRDDESEADNASVKYLCPTHYNAAGSAGFFKKMLNNPVPPEFLSTHPSPKTRVKDIEDLKNKAACSGTQTNREKYEKMKKLLK